MSFAFTAAGTTDQVREQLAAAQLHGGDTSQADKVLAFLLSEVDAWPKCSFPGKVAGLIVEASGHHDTAHRSVSVSMRTLWLPVAETTTAETTTAEGAEA